MVGQICVDLTGIVHVKAEVVFLFRVAKIILARSQGTVCVQPIVIWLNLPGVFDDVGVSLNIIQQDK